MDAAKKYANRYLVKLSLFKTTKINFEAFVYTNDSREFVEGLIKECQKKPDVSSIWELMDYICNTYDMQWEDATPDIEIELDENNF